MIPTPRLVALAALGALVAGLAQLVAVPERGWQVPVAALFLLAAADAWRARRAPAPRVERRVAGSLPLGVASPVGLRAHNPGGRPVRLRVADHYPPACLARDLPVTLRVDPGAWVEVAYRLSPQERGLHRFGPVQVWQESPLGLWRRNRYLEVADQVRVYPNFAAVGRYALYALDRQLRQLGALRQRRRGEGSEFHQLRDFRPGDALRQVDWGATARLRRPISREYQEERDQTVVFLLDCGRRMRSRDGALSHFDQALNAVLLMSYVALRKGDAVGVATFGGAPRWLAPVKGQANLPRLLNTLYDLQPAPVVPDYLEAATALTRQRGRRALVVLVTNLRDEDAGDLGAAVRLLRRRHLVLVASLREASLDRELDGPVVGLEGAVRRAATHDYLARRRRMLEVLRGEAVAVLDTVPERLSMELVSTYLNVKARQAL